MLGNDISDLEAATATLLLSTKPVSFKHLFHIVTSVFSNTAFTERSAAFTPASALPASTREGLLLTASDCQSVET